jgi:WD40 repeat protein
MIMAFNFLKNLDADDIFISYARLDASTYAAGLADELTKRGFSCFIDKLGTDPDEDLPDSLKRKIRSCSMLVIVGTAWAAKRQAIKEEVEVFVSTGRTSVVPIDFGDTVYDAEWYKPIAGVAPEPELNPNALDDGEPSPSVVSRIEKQFNYRRRDERLRRITRRAVAVLVFLLVLIIVAAVVAERQIARAAAEQARAERQAAIADIHAGANRSQNYLRQRPDDVSGSLSFALDALKTAERVGLRSADADAALRESLALFPVRRSRVRLPFSIDLDLAFSPDGLHYATVDKKTLRVYAVGEEDADGATPLLERPCECTTVALDSGLVRAAVVLNEGRGFKIFDLKDDSRSRVFESFRGARGEKITAASKLALNPGGRYLALYAREGKEEGKDYSKLLVLDAASGVPAKVYDDDAPGGARAEDIASRPTGKLNMFIRDVAFGPTGDLAIVGQRADANAWRVVIWHLGAEAPDADARTKLTADSFNRYEIIPQEGEVIAVAPGADETYFATDKGVWKRPTWKTSFDPVARIPSPTKPSFSSSSIERIAFRPDGKSLVLIRNVIYQQTKQSRPEETTVEVWDAAGHRDLAETFHTADVIHVGFEPGGRLVAALTDRDSNNVTNGPLGENRAHRLRVYQTDTGSEVASTEPTPEDRSMFYYAGPDAAQIVTLSGSTVKVWDVWAKDEAKRERDALFGGALESLESVGLSPGGRFLALAGPSGDTKRVVVYRSDGGEYAEVKRFHLGKVDFGWTEGMALSADGRRLAVTYKDKKNPVHVFDDGVENTALRRSLDGLSDVYKVALSADGRYLAVSDGYDPTPTFLTAILGQVDRVRLLDTSEGSWETMLDDEHVASIAFSPDGAYIGLGSDEGVLHVFETAKSKDEGGAKGDAQVLKEEVARLQHIGSVTAVAFSDDGRYVATANRPHLLRAGEHEPYPLRVWLLRPADLIAEAERRLHQVKPSER